MWTTICRREVKVECKEIKWILSGEADGEMTAARLDFNSIEIKSFGSKSSAAGSRQAAHIYNCSIRFPFECVSHHHHHPGPGPRPHPLCHIGGNGGSMAT